MCVCVCVHARACMRACLGVCVWACVRVCVLGGGWGATGRGDRLVGGRAHDSWESQYLMYKRRLASPTLSSFVSLHGVSSLGSRMRLPPMSKRF